MKSGPSGNLISLLELLTSTIPTMGEQIVYQLHQNKLNQLIPINHHWWLQKTTFLVGVAYLFHWHPIWQLPSWETSSGQDKPVEEPAAYFAV